MATICNSFSTYDSTGSVNGKDGGTIVKPSKSNVKYLKCPSYLTYSSNSNTSINIDDFPDTKNTDNPYSQCTNNQTGNCKHKLSNTGTNVERWTILQNTCSIHAQDRTSKNISIGDGIIDYTDFQALYDAVSQECSARNIDFNISSPSSYASTLVDNENPFEYLNNYLISCNNAASGSKHQINVNITSISLEQDSIIKHSNVTAIASNLRNITSDCICYSDCNGYSVCYCYGNCQYY